MRTVSPAPACLPWSSLWLPNPASASSRINPVHGEDLDRQVITEGYQTWNLHAILPGTERSLPSLASGPVTIKLRGGLSTRDNMRWERTSRKASAAADRGLGHKNHDRGRAAASELGLTTGMPPSTARPVISPYLLFAPHCVTQIIRDKSHS